MPHVDSAGVAVWDLSVRLVIKCSEYCTWTTP